MYDLGIINGEVWLDGGYINTNLYVKDGRIAAISSDKLECADCIDVSGKKILPGFIDPHVHFSLTVARKHIDRRFPYRLNKRTYGRCNHVYRLS